jgi:hypothetical protein
MPCKRINPYLVKIHRSYTASELAARLGLHKNTIRQWQRDGLAPVDAGRPTLFQGAIVRAFLIGRNASRKRPCPPGTLYCLRCREPRRPALAMADYVELQPGTGNLRAICEACGTIMHRRVCAASVAAVMPLVDVQIREAPSRLVGCDLPSLNCDLERQDAA